jgi:uncharacterized membrane protein YhhN
MSIEIHLIFLGALGIVSMVYLITLFFKPKIYQYILKGCLIPLIFAVYITGVEQEKILIPIILALFFAWVGDILLIKINNILCFRLGLASFLLGHVCYIIAMVEFIQTFNILVLIISIITAALLGFSLYKFVKPTSEMKIPVIAYESVILTMAIFALQVFINHGSSFGTLVFIGSLSFVLSDASLAMVTFQKKRYYVFCMATYIAAQLLISLGFTAI